MIVIDASVANKLFLTGEAGYKKVKEIFRKHSEGINIIVVPDLLFYEVTNTLATKSAVPMAKIAGALNQLDRYGLEIFRPSVVELTKAASLAKDHHVSVYDAIYVILAVQNECDLMTADEKFVKQVNLPFVKSLSSI